MSSQSKHPWEISSLKSTSGLLNSFGNWNGCCESLCACLSARVPWMSQAFAVQRRPARLCPLPLRRLPGSPQLANLPRLYEGRAVKEPTLGNSHAQNAWVCWEVRAEPALVKRWHVGCCCAAWLPLAGLCFGGLLGAVCASAAAAGVGSVWPSVSKMRTADQLLHRPSLPCMAVWCVQQHTGWRG